MAARRVARPAACRSVASSAWVSPFRVHRALTPVHSRALAPRDAGAGLRPCARCVPPPRRASPLWITIRSCACLRKGSCARICVLVWDYDPVVCCGITIPVVRCLRPCAPPPGQAVLLWITIPLWCAVSARALVHVCASWGSRSRKSTRLLNMLKCHRFTCVVFHARTDNVIVVS